MTIEEFKAWFEGFSEHIEDAPTPDQWAKLRARLKEVKAAPAPFQIIPYTPAIPVSPCHRPWTERVYLDPYTSPTTVPIRWTWTPYSVSN